MKKIGLILFVFAFMVTETKAADSWEAKKDSGAWEEDGYIYAVGQATYEQEMNETDEAKAFNAAKKIAAEKIKKAKSLNQLKGLQVVNFRYNENEVLVLIAIPTPAIGKKAEYPACEVASENWKVKVNGDVFNCDLAGKVYTYAITMVSYTSDKDKDKARQSAIDDGKKVLSSHIAKPIDEMIEKHGFYVVEIQDDTKAKTLKVLSRCIMPSPIPDGTTTVSVQISKNEKISDTDSFYSYTTEAEIEKVEAVGVTSEAQIIVACDELAITKFDKIPDQWWLFYDKNKKYFRVGNTLYTIGRGLKAKKDKDWTGAQTAGKTEAQRELVRITGNVVTHIVCEKNDKTCATKTNVSGIAKGLKNEKEFKDENSKLDNKPCYVLMAVPFKLLVLFMAQLAIANVPEQNPTESYFDLTDSMLFPLNLSRNNTAIPLVWEGEKNGIKHLYAIASQPIDAQNETKCSGKKEDCLQIDNMVRAILNCGKILKRMLGTQLQNVLSESSLVKGKDIIQVSSAPGNLINIDSAAIPDLVKSPDSRFSAVIMAEKKKGKIIYYGFGTALKSEKNPFALARQRAKQNMANYLEIPATTFMPQKKCSRAGQDVWVLMYYTQK